MSEYRYTAEDREAQLRELVAVLPPLIEHVRGKSQFASVAPKYQEAFDVARALLSSGFTQEKLSALGRSIPDIFDRHKEWIPPSVEQEGGLWVEEQWFTDLEAVLRPALRAAGILCIVGYY
jgi:hypothetical protein